MGGKPRESKAERQSRRDKPHPSAPKIIKPGEIVSIVLGGVGILLVFFIGAPAAAGVTDMNFSRFLLLGGCVAAVVLALIIERLYRRSWKRILITLVITAVAGGGLAMYANDWIGKKRAEQEAKAVKDSSSMTEARQPDKSETTQNSNAAEQPKNRNKNSKAERLRRLREQALRDLHSRNP